MRHYGVTHIGLRENNEDRFLIRELEDGNILLAVADGMGGHVGGEQAAQITVQSMLAFRMRYADPQEQMVNLAQDANRKISELMQRDASLDGMGTTLTAALIGNGAVHWVHAGDSRLYLIREGVIVQVTDDHTVPGLLLQEGEISRAEAHIHPMRNVLLNCICGERFELDTGILPVSGGDLILLSTDGLHDSVPEERIISILTDSNASLRAKLNALINAALTEGGRDNITVVGVEIK